MQQIQPFDWHRIWLGDEFPLLFLLEIAFRSVFMYLLILGALRLTGKRGVKQLSLFELTIILGLGSAAGDAMFYHDVPIVHALVAFGVVILLYLAFNNLTERSRYFEKLLEGAAVCVIDAGKIDVKSFIKENLTYAELFGEMRQQQVEHLGQVRRVYLEATGEISIFFMEDKDVKPGLPIFPEIYTQATEKVNAAGIYSCVACGNTLQLQAGTKECPDCRKTKWVTACHSRRVV